MTAQDIAKLIQIGLPNAEVTVKSDDGRHFAASVVSPDFADKSRVQQHQMVYATLGDSLGGALHALQLTTSTPVRH